MLKTLYVSVSLLILAVVAVTIITCTSSDRAASNSEAPPVTPEITVVAPI